ncbi:hypothetical protein ACTXG6_45820 [Pseudonocardia sp. Cha107L01]|uniref:hypothetical protein n=1 Tax=Pseudonocardia sp. Cha107L01 TaxID=3457576 RepID=UPI00403ED257
MSSGISLSGGHLDIGPDGHGHFRATIPSLSDFKGVVAYLNSDALLYTPTDGKPHKLQLTDPDPAPPTTFPATVTFEVTETPIPPGSPRELMLLLSASDERPPLHLSVVDYSEPAHGETGHLTILCDTPNEYQAIVGHLTTGEGGILKSYSGGVWVLRHQGDDVEPESTFPRTVRFEVLREF